MRWRINPKRGVIPDRVLRRAVTRGVDTIWWAKIERDKKKNINNNQEIIKPNDKLNWLTVAAFILLALLFSIITKSC